VPGGTEETPVRIAGIWIEILTRYLRSTRADRSTAMFFGSVQLSRIRSSRLFPHRVITVLLLGRETNQASRGIRTHDASDRAVLDGMCCRPCSYCKSSATHFFSVKPCFASKLCRLENRTFQYTDVMFNLWRSHVSDQK
jgi:hypothetical protein